MINFKFIYIVFLLAMILSCSTGSDGDGGPIVYERIVIDTYGWLAGADSFTYLDLFDASGDTDADDPWSGDDTADAIASDDNGNPNPTHTNCARIDYTGGLSSGTYYIRVRLEASGSAEPYVIRVLSLSVGEAVPAYIYPGSSNASDTPYEPDDNPQSGGVPTNSNPIQLGNSNYLNRYLATSDVDWIELVLQ